MSNILLIKPGSLSFEQRDLAHLMGLPHIGATLKNAGYELNIHNRTIDYITLRILNLTTANGVIVFISIPMVVDNVDGTKIILMAVRQTLLDTSVVFRGPFPSANHEAER